jgi:hypothetical protein
LQACAPVLAAFVKGEFSDTSTRDRAKTLLRSLLPLAKKALVSVSLTEYE